MKGWMAMKGWMTALLIGSLLLSGCASSLPGSSVTSAGPASTAPGHPLKQWLRQKSRAQKGAAAGAITGALLGAMRARILGHDPLKAAAAGAVAGGIAGFLIGRRQDTLHGSRDAAIALLGYDRSQGYILAVEEVRFEPPRIAPGGTAQVYVRYLVVGPSKDEDLSVEASTGVKYDGTYMQGMGPDTFVVPRGGGIVETRSQVTIPAQAPAGTYSIETLLEDRHGRFSSSREERLYVAG